MNSAKMKALMDIIQEMDDSMVSGMKNKIGGKKPIDVKVMKVDLKPTSENSEDEESPEEESGDAQEMGGVEEDAEVESSLEDDDILKKLKEKYGKK